mgnify:CR=1 FL=1
MKKVLLVIGTIISLTVFASCSNEIDSKINAFEKACKSGDPTAITKAAEALEKVDKNLATEEQKARVAKIFVECKNK